MKEKVVDHFGETQHDEDARKLVENAHEKMNRMPLDKASCMSPVRTNAAVSSPCLLFGDSRSSLFALQYTLKRYLAAIGCASEV